MVGESPGLEKVSDAVRRAAPTNATVLITGESGVGKELVARAIHRNSLRKDEAFVQVNCAAIPEELIESELFGHEKGSFTGATEKQIGKFELAHKGTIFLDEVGDMSLRTQAKVLRVLQEGEVERIGSQKTIQVDVRVIAATNKRLEEQIEKGDFREDLYFRLSVIPVRVPPLRERADDVPVLVRALRGAVLRREQLPQAAPSPPRPSRRLKRHAWRGNVRELKNAVERLLIMVGGRRDPARAPRRGAAPAGRGAGGRGPRARSGTSRKSAERAFLVGKLHENAAGTSPPPPPPSALPAPTSTRSSSSTRSPRKRTAEVHRAAGPVTDPEGEDRERCRGCGAFFRDLVCEYCGLASRRVEDPALERAALDEFHVLLRRCEPDAQDKLLREGFLPASAANLLEAAVLCVPYLQSGTSVVPPVGGAAVRLEAIVAKLSVLPKTDELERAIRVYEARLAGYRGAERASAREGMIFLGLLGLAIVGGLVWMISRIFR